MSKANDNVGRIRRSWGSGNDFGEPDTNGRDMNSDLLEGRPSSDFALAADVAADNAAQDGVTAEKVTGSWTYDSGSNTLTILTT